MPRFDLTNPAILKQLLMEVGIEPSRSSGQNFLICDSPINTTIAAIADGPKQVTELGAGHGPLTLALLNAGYHVRAIERDQVLSGILQRVLAKELKQNLELVLTDLKKVDWAWSVPYQLVGNIPYNLSGLILRRITELKPAPTRVVLLIQKEVGQRLVAQPPNMNILGIAIQLWGTPKILATVPATCFWPQPEVQSQLVEITPHARAQVNKTDQIILLKIAKQLFQTKRKQLAGSIARAFKLERTVIDQVLLEANVRPEQRPQELTIKQWYKLTQLLLTKSKA